MVLMDSLRARLIRKLVSVCHNNIRLDYVMTVVKRHQFDVSITTVCIRFNIILHFRLNCCCCCYFSIAIGVITVVIVAIVVTVIITN